jgi:hypothetical protein
MAHAATRCGITVTSSSSARTPSVTSSNSSRRPANAKHSRSTSPTHRRHHAVWRDRAAMASTGTFPAPELRGETRTELGRVRLLRWDRPDAQAAVENRLRTAEQSPGARYPGALRRRLARAAERSSRARPDPGRRPRRDRGRGGALLERLRATPSRGPTLALTALMRVMKRCQRRQGIRSTHESACSRDSATESRGSAPGVA